MTIRKAPERVRANAGREGATLARRGDHGGIRRYDGPAGGWGALRATARTVRAQMDTAEAAATLLRVNKPDGFDCPGCAWPDKDHTSTFQFCENGAKAVSWEATRKRATPELFARHTVSELWTWSDHALEDAGRLTEPMVYDAASDTYRAIAWDAAFARAGAALRALPDPDAVEFYTSGRTSNEAAFLYQLFAREFGTNNFPDCSNLCHEATSVGLPGAIGIGKGTVSLEDFDHADLLLALGHNPGTNHPRMMGTLHEMARRGVPIIVFNPMRERALERFADPQNAVEMTTLGSQPIASVFHQVRVGGDGAALTGIMKALLALDAAAPSEAVVDHAFIAAHTTGWEAFAEGLRAADWDDIVRASGLSRTALESVAAAYAGAKATIVTYGMGVTQHARGVDQVRQIANLLLMRGNFGRPGAGICPLRGHSNVQGDRTVGITEKPTPALLARIEAVFGFTPPAAHGHDAVAALQAIVAGRSKALICLGGNLAVAMPDPAACFPALRRLDLTVHIATKLNRSHLLVGRESLILPCLGRTEADVQAGGAQSVTVEDSMSMVHASRGRLPPASPHLRSEPAIVAGLAAATLPGSRVDWTGLVADYDRIRDAIAAVFPGFEDFNTRVRVPGGFRLPLPPRERIWNTPTGKARFIGFGPVTGGLDDAIGGAAETAEVLRLTTVRSHDQYNTTIYGLDDRYRGVFGRRDVLFVHAADLAARGLKSGDRVDVETAFRHGPPRRLAGLTTVAHDIARGCVATYFPEANVLAPLDHGDPASGTPAYKSIPVRLVAAAERA